MLETETGRASATARDDMIADAIEWLSGRARGSAGAINGRTGRPAAVIPEADKAAAKALWFDLRRPNREVKAMLPNTMSVDRCYQLFGARWAPPKSEKK